MIDLCLRAHDVHLLKRIPSWQVSPGVLALSPLLEYHGSMLFREDGVIESLNDAATVRALAA